MKKGKMKKAIKRAAALFFPLSIAAALLCAGYTYRNDRKYRGRFRELEQAEKEAEKGKKPQEGSNPDWIGWLRIKGTSIDYPVMQRGSEYYLHRDFDGNYSFYGTPFLDIRCGPESDNCIIYGHNINGGRMFGALHAYSDQGFYEGHPEVWLRIGGEKRTYHIVSVIKADTSSGLYSFTDVGNWEEYREHAQEILEGSLYRTEQGSRIIRDMEERTAEGFFHSYQFLTLSTCRSWAGRDARLMVVAARERDGTG